MAPPNLKKMLQVKIKPRQDSYTDQFSRIFMVKMLMLTATITGISWMKDNLNCIVPKTHDVSGKFVSRACWINGLYVFRDLGIKDESFYYGIPSEIGKDGVDEYGNLCKTKNQLGNIIPGCTPLHRTFFLQYQWFPIGVAALSFLYYLPYLLFRLINADLQQIKNMIKEKSVDDVDSKEIIKRFFSRKGKSSSSHLRARILLNIIVKVLYVVVNIIGMVVIDIAVNGYYMGYGSGWSKWSGRSNEGRHDYTRLGSGEGKPGHELLPAFAMCQVASSGQDIKNKVANVHTYICELSQHVLYQYILLILWYTFIVGIIISIVGFLKHIYNVVSVHFLTNTEGSDVAHVYTGLSAREKEYMNFIKRKNLPVFGKLIKDLHDKMYSGRSTSESDRSEAYPDRSEADEKQSMM